MRGPGGSHHHRGGIAVLVVLVVLSSILGLSYAMLRSQATAVMISRNSDRLGKAQHAARSGLLIALNTMHRSSEWQGPTSVLTGNLSETESYVATYSVGDPSLSSGDADWELYPYRVTISVTGASWDPADPAIRSTHELQAVVQLTPVQMPAEPTDWTTLQQFAVFQGEAEAFQVELPSRITGPTRIQGALTLVEKAPNTSSSRNRYLDDLYQMLAVSYGDYRPFNGPVFLDYGNSGTGLGRLGQLGVTTYNTAAAGLASDWLQPTGFSTYRLYTGGPLYTIPTISTNPSSTTFEPNQLTNPLGLFACSSTVTIGNNVTLEGTLLCSSKLIVNGTNVNFQPVELPALDGTTTPVRLPSVTCSDFTIQASASGSATGMVAVFEDLEIKKGSDDYSFAFTGPVVVEKVFRIEERSEWSSTSWSFWYSLFTSSSPSGSLQYFPVYMDVLVGRDLPPVITFQLDPQPVVYHWLFPSAGVAVFEPGSGDVGLRWELLSQTDL